LLDGARARDVKGTGKSSAAASDASATISTVCCVETRILVPGMHANAGQVTGCSSNLKRPPACRLWVVNRDGGPGFLLESELFARRPVLTTGVAAMSLDLLNLALELSHVERWFPERTNEAGPSRPLVWTKSAHESLASIARFRSAHRRRARRATLSRTTATGHWPWTPPRIAPLVLMP
jgi:hypothetical protein